MPACMGSVAEPLGEASVLTRRERSVAYSTACVEKADPRPVGTAKVSATDLAASEDLVAAAVVMASRPDTDPAAFTLAARGDGEGPACVTGRFGGVDEADEAAT